MSHHSKSDQQDVIAIEQGALAASLVPSSRTVRRNGRGKAFAEVGLFQLEAAAEFSADRSLSAPLRLIAEFRRHEFSAVLREATDSSPCGQVSSSPGVPVMRPSKPGRPRLDGDWAALYLAQVAAGMTAVQPFYDQFVDTDIWTICGFSQIPSPALVHQRLGALDERSAAFAEVAQGLIQLARANEPRVGEIVAVDATGWHSPSALEHCCPDDDACLAAGGMPLPRLTSDDPGSVLRARWDEAELDEDATAGMQPKEDGFPRIEMRTSIEGRRRSFSFHRIGGHIYRSLDLDSGYRTYDGGTKWFGGYLLAGIDVLTGLPVGVEVFGAHIQEWNGYPALFDQMARSLGEPPYIVSTDKGYANRLFYEFNTRRGVAVVSPRKGTRNRKSTLDWRTDAFDEHGIPRCRHCGGEATQDAPGLGLAIGGTTDPLIRFRCLRPIASACAQVQSIRAAEDWRMLIPLSRKTELYHAVRWAHSNKEHVFRHVREKYALAGKDFTGRLARPGMAPQRLRAQASLLLDWFRVALRHGWLPSRGLDVTINSTSPKRLSGNQDRSTGEILELGCGTANLRRLLADRAEAETDVPYRSGWQSLPAFAIS